MFRYCAKVLTHSIYTFILRWPQMSQQCPHLKEYHGVKPEPEFPNMGVMIFFLLNDKLGTDTPDYVCLREQIIQIRICCSVFGENRRII